MSCTPSKKIKLASVKLATCTACVEGRRVGQTFAKYDSLSINTACITLLHVASKNNIGSFNFDRQTIKFNSPSDFPAIRYFCI